MDKQKVTELLMIYEGACLDVGREEESRYSRTDTHISYPVLLENARAAAGRARADLMKELGLI